MMAGFADHFQIVNNAIGPQPWMQQRELARGSVAAVSKSYDPSDGNGKNELLQTVEVPWTNDTPVPQLVYGMVTRDGCRVTLQTRSRGYLQTSHGVLVGAGTIVMNEVGRVGCGADVGKGGLLTLNAAFSIAEVRSQAGTVHLLPGSTGMWLVQPGESIRGRVEVRFKSEFWEAGTIDGGDSGTESSILSGETLLQLMALPVVVPPPPVTIPTIVGGAGNVTADTSFVSTTTPACPTGLAEGDILIAIACTQFGDAASIQPNQTGWTLAHKRNTGFGSYGDVHMKIYVRTVGDPGALPANWSFDGGFLAEGITIIIPIRGAVPFNASQAANWYIGSNLSTWKLVETHVAPSLDRKGQLLLAVSYFDHSPTQAPLHQTPPVGMTEIKDTAGTISTMAVAMLPSPPQPTFVRKFTPAQTPIFRGHSIAAAILIPGIQEL